MITVRISAISLAAGAVWCVLAPLGTSAHASPRTEAQALAERFVATLQADDPAAADLCSADFRSRDRLSCDALVGDVVQLDLPLIVGKPKPKRGVVIVPMRLQRGTGWWGLWLVASETPDGWRFVDGTDEDGPDTRGLPALPKPPPAELPEDPLARAVQTGDHQDQQNKIKEIQFFIAVAHKSFLIFLRDNVRKKWRL